MAQRPRARRALRRANTRLALRGPNDIGCAANSEAVKIQKQSLHHPQWEQPWPISWGLTNEGNRRPGAGAKRRTPGVRVDREVRHGYAVRGQIVEYCSGLNAIGS